MLVLNTVMENLPVFITRVKHEMPDQMFITLLSKSFLEIRDLGLRDFD